MPLIWVAAIVVVAWWVGKQSATPANTTPVPAQNTNTAGLILLAPGQMQNLPSGPTVGAPSGGVYVNYDKL